MSDPASIPPEMPTEEAEVPEQAPSVAPETPTETTPETPPSAASSPVEQWGVEDADPCHPRAEDADPCHPRAEDADADSDPACDGCHHPEDDCICGLDECWHCGERYDPETSGWSRYCSGGCASDDGYYRGYARHAACHHGY